jgi:hypothetical protein
MAKSKAKQGSAYQRRIAPKRKLISDPPVIIGGGSVKVFFKSTANEIIPSPRPGYRCFQMGGNIKKLSFYDGETPGLQNLDVKNSKMFFTQADE